MQNSKIDLLIKALVQEQKDIEIESLFNLFLNHSKTKCRPGTIEHYTKDFNIINNWLKSNNVFSINGLNNQVIDNFINYKKLKGNKAITINQQINILHFAINYGIKNEIINSDPIKNCTRLIEDCYKGPVLSKNQLIEIYKYIDKTGNSIRELKLKAGTLLMFDTGIRINELCNIKLTDLDLKNNTINLSYTKAHENRNLYIIDKTKNTLLIFINRAKITKGYLFGTTKTKATQQPFKRYLYKIEKDLNLPLKINNRLIRRTFATLLSEQNINIAYLMELMGHHNLRTTQRYINSNKKAIQNTHANLSILNVVPDRF